MNPPGRPIVSGSGVPTEKISQLVDHFIGQIVPLSQSYIRDSTHLINILNGFTVQPGMLLCTLDVTSLYTNIPHNEGIQSSKEMLAIYKPPDSLPHNSYIIELLELVLTNNHFEFNCKHDHQTSGLQWAQSWHLHMSTYLWQSLRKICMYISSTAKTMEEVHRQHFHVEGDFLLNKINFVGGDKLLPVFKHGFLRSEENVFPVFLYTQNVYGKMLSFTILNFLMYGC